MVANGKPYPVSQAVLPPLTRNLRIGYAALSLSIPERVRTRYKLEGSDKDWQDAGNLRDATYTNLGPRKYRFRVIACNNDGIWNVTGASWSFEIEPAFYQTPWFQGLYALAGATVVWLVHRFRLRKMTAQVNLRHTERLAERTRIARELHDTLLQSFHGLMFRFQAARNMLPGRPEEAIEAREAVRNAFRHAQASNIEADITYYTSSFQLRIRDDGKGIDARIVGEGRAGHYGVSGMRERARRIGGKLDVWTGTGAGTEIELTIPGSIAYGTSPSRSVLGLFRKKAKRIHD